MSNIYFSRLVVLSCHRCVSCGFCLMQNSPYSYLPYNINKVDMNHISAECFRRLLKTYLFARYYTVFQKSDAKIQITITMTHLIRINYPLTSFNYRLFGTNVANFNKICHIVSELQL